MSDDALIRELAEALAAMKGELKAIRQEMTSLLGETRELLKVQREMFEFQKSFRAQPKPKPAPAAVAPPTEPAPPRKTDKGDILTTTGFVRKLGLIVKDGEPALTKKGGKQWGFELDNGFNARVFRQGDFDKIELAVKQRRTLVVEFIEAGQFKNIESIKLGAETKPEPPKKEENPFGEDKEDPEVETSW